MARHAVLFVDDEPLILNAMSRAFFADRGRWDQEFVIGGAAALDRMDQRAFHVVVSDMRMPDMDGARFLAEVRRRQPSAARFLLSGGTDTAGFARAVTVAHQLLGKPCPVPILRATIERACTLQSMLDDAPLREMVRQVDTLPSMPDVFDELRRGVDDAATDTAMLAGIIQRDPAMSLRVLQLANCSYLALGEPTSSVRVAVERLGQERVRELTRGSSAFVRARPEMFAPEFSLPIVQRCSLETAAVAKRIVGDPALEEAAFTAGLLHDVGLLVFAALLGDRFGEILRIAQSSGRFFPVVEREVLGVTHAEVGGYLLGTWGVPAPIVEAVASHHTPSHLPGDTFGLVGALHVADAVVECVAGNGTLDDRLDHEFIARTGTGHRLPEWRRLAAELASS